MYLDGREAIEIWSAVETWLGQAPDPFGDAILHWRVPLALCVTEDDVQIQEWFQALRTSGEDDCLARTRDIFPEAGGFNADLLPSSGELFGSDEPDWSLVDTGRCPLSGGLRHGDAAQSAYELVTEGPTIEIEEQGLGSVTVVGYLQESLPALFQALEHIQDSSDLRNNRERLVFHQDLVIDVSHTEDDSRCPIVLVPRQNTMTIDPAYLRLLVANQAESPRETLANVIIHSALHLLTETSPLDPAPSTPTPPPEPINPPGA